MGGDSQLIVAIMNSAVGALVGAIVSGFGILFVNKFNYRNMYAETVSSNRMDWINQFREEIGTVVACIETPYVNRNSQQSVAAEKARAKLLTRLNMDTTRTGNEYNAVMANVLCELNFWDASPPNRQCVETLLLLTRKILEPEWRRVKREADGRSK